MPKMISAVLFFLSFVVASGCITSLKPQDLRDDEGADRHISLSQVVQNYEACRGKTVLWGGEIVRCINKKEGTLIEILQLPLDSSNRPKTVDISQGRFLTLSPGYLDGIIYRPKREVTVMGEIQGLEIHPLGETEYTYPFLKAKTVHLWALRPETIRVYHEYPFYPYQFPYWLGYPFWW